MSSDKHGIKDQVTGKAKEIKGKVTGDRSKAAEGKLQKNLGKAKEKARSIKDSLTKKGEV